jgi:surfactin synthase thioesterase subunit
MTVTTSATIESVTSAIDLARAKVSELKAAAAVAGDSLLAKVASDIASLTERLGRLEQSFTVASKTAPLHRRG